MQQVETRPRFTPQEVIRATGATHRPSAGGTGGVRAACGVSTDSRRLTTGELFVALRGPNFDGHRFLEAAAEAGAFGAVVARGAAPSAAVAGRLELFEVPDTLVALGALARLHRDRFPDMPVIAVTGSNGKTTTKELIAAALAPLGAGHRTSGNFNNRIGLPLTLFGVGAEHRWVVVEMGMNEPGEIAALTRIARPGVGLVTSAAAAHLEGLGSIDAVARAKAELYDHLPDGAAAIVNLDDPRLPDLAEAAGAIEAGGRLRRIGYGAHPGSDVRLGDVAVGRDGTLVFDVLLSAAIGGTERVVSMTLPLLGRHNAHNACGALAAALAVGADAEAAAEAMAAVTPAARRLQPKAGPDGSLLLDDCYNAGPASVRAALETGAELAAVRGGRLIAALGDMLELGDEEAARHEEMGRLAVEAGARVLVAFGPRSAAAARAAKRAGLRAVLHTEDAEAAVGHLAEAAGIGDVILVKGSRGLAMERIADPLSGMAKATAEVAVVSASPKATDGGGSR